MIRAAGPHPAPPASDRRGSLRSSRSRQQWWGYLFLAPVLVPLAVFKLLPMLRAAQLSLTSYDLLDPPRPVGLANYAALLQDPLFHQSLGATVYYVLGISIPVWLLSLALALALHAALPARAFLQLLVVVPTMIPVVVYAMIWRFMLHPQGLLNRALELLGVPPVAWLTDGRATMPGLILAGEWRLVPFFAILYLAGLRAVPREYHEAAAIDGASWWGRLRFVTLPLLKPTVALVVVTSLILTSKVFTNVLIISNGGPAGATRVLSLFVFQTGFQYLKMGLACAAAMVLLLGTLTLTLAYLRLARGGVHG